MTIYFLSDTHFGHKRIIEFERSRFKTIEEHDKFILNLIKSKMNHNNVLYHLGDFGFLSKENECLWKSIPGKKILIKGNHDRNLKKLRKLFDKVITTPYWLNDRVLLSHEPLPVTDGTINLHGHLHNADLFLTNYYNMNIHFLNYKMFSDKKINNILSTMKKDNYKFLYEWYASHYHIIGDNNKIVYNEDGKVNLEETRKNY